MVQPKPLVNPEPKTKVMPKPKPKVAATITVAQPELETEEVVTPVVQPTVTVTVAQPEQLAQQPKSLMDICNDDPLSIEVMCYDARDTVLAEFNKVMKAFPVVTTVTKAFIIEAYIGSHSDFMVTIFKKSSGSAPFYLAAESNSGSARYRIERDNLRSGVIIHANDYIFGGNGVTLPFLLARDLVVFQAVGNEGVSLEEYSSLRKKPITRSRMDAAAEKGYMYLVAGIRGDRSGTLSRGSNHCENRKAWCIATRWQHYEGGGTSAAVGLLGGVMANVIATFPATVSVHWLVDQVLTNATYVTLTPTVQMVKAINLLSVPLAVNEVRSSLGMPKIDVSAMQADIFFGSSRPAVPGTTEINTVEGSFAFSGGEYKLSSVPLVTHLAQLGDWSLGVSANTEKGLFARNGDIQFGYSRSKQDSFFGVRGLGRYDATFRYNRWLASIELGDVSITASALVGRGGNKSFSQSGRATELSVELPVAISKNSTLTFSGSVGKFKGGALRIANRTSTLQKATDYQLKLVFSYNW